MWRRERDHGFWNSLERRIQAEWLAVVAIMLGLTACLSYFSSAMGITRVDHILYDRMLSATAVNGRNEDIVIIAVDDGSIAELGHWPWRRAVHAELLSRLQQARVVGFDVLFGDGATAYPADDAALASAIARHGKVVLPLAIRKDGRSVMPPLSELARVAAAVGHINVYADTDGAVRSLRLRQRLGAGAIGKHFVLSMLEVAGIAPSGAEQGRVDELIPFGAPATEFTVYPYAKVLGGQIPPAAFKNKLVLVGYWASGMGDTFPTPVSNNKNGMPGVEVLANGLQAAMAGNWIRTPPSWLAALLACLPVFGVCLLYRRLSPRRSFIAMLATLGLVAVGAALVLGLVGIWVPITACLLGVALSMPMWGWRSQEASLQHIDRELKALNRDRAALGDDVGMADTAIGDASLPARVTALHGAIGQLRIALDRREETLRFLSHDMRSPQTSILALTQLQQHAHTALDQSAFLSRIDAYAHKTLGLVDGFVNLARAQVMQLQSKEVDLIDLIELCMDEFWARACQRHIGLRFETYPDHVWVRGDPSLLQRSFANLIDNAIKYSPDGGHVECTITAEGDLWCVSVRDEGRGFSAEQAPRLLQPFSRLNEHVGGNPEGAGLGLAFVKTVVDRHGGSIRVSSQEGCGAQFDLLLPKARQADLS